jgi:protein TonB
MSSRARSPRPVEFLPPTLLPNPVFLAAPRPDRATSLLAACVVYGALGAAVFGGARHLDLKTAVHPPTEPMEWVLPHDVMPPAEPVVAPPPSGSTVPAGFQKVNPPMDSNTVPLETPQSLPTEDLRHTVAVGPDSGLHPGIQGLPTTQLQPPPVITAPAHSAPLEVDFREMRILHQVAPVYPPLARLVKAQGAVELRMTIDAQGVPTDIQVISGPHPMLVNEAVRVARLWRFQPATQDGVPVAAAFRLTVGFRLER